MNILKITHASIEYFVWLLIYCNGKTFIFPAQSFLQITRIQINDNLLFFLGKLNKYFVVILHNQLQKWHESHLRDNLLKVNHVNTLNCSNLIYIFCIAELRLEYKIRNRSGISFSIIQNKHKLYFFIDLNNSLKNITLIYMQQWIRVISYSIYEYHEVYFSTCSLLLQTNLIP